MPWRQGRLACQTRGCRCVAVRCAVCLGVLSNKWGALLRNANPYVRKHNNGLHAPDILCRSNRNARTCGGMDIGFQRRADWNGLWQDANHAEVAKYSGGRAIHCYWNLLLYNYLFLGIMEIKVLGTGCSKCKTTYSIIEKVIKENNVHATLTKVEDIMEIMSHNILTTPAVVIDGEVRSKGSVPSEKEIKKWLGV